MNTDSELMKTEIDNATFLVREARKEVEKLREQSTLTKPQRNKLQTLCGILNDLDDLLVLESLRENLMGLRETSEKLTKITDQIKEKITGFMEAGEAISKAAKVTGKLADAITKAVSKGIL